MQAWIEEIKISHRHKSSIKCLRRKAKCIDSLGNVMYGPFHRKEFGRNIFRQTIKPPLNCYRFYFLQKKELNATLKSYNRKVEECRSTPYHESHFNLNPFYGKQKFQSAGYANVRFRFCTICQDNEKEGLEEDLYFVDDALKPIKRTTLCLGCMGAYLKSFLVHQQHISQNN